MRLDATSILLITLCALLLSACSLRPAKAAAKPPVSTPAPAPAKPPAETASADPISVPQTQVTLPRPQPIQEEALATVQPDTQPAPEPVNPSARPPRNTPPARSDRQQATAPAPPAAPAPTVVPPPSRERIRPVESPAEREKLLAGINHRKKLVNDVLAKAKTRQLSESDKGNIERINAFIEQTDAALKDQDLQQAEALSNRALLLSQVLEK